MDSSGRSNIKIVVELNRVQQIAEQMANPLCICSVCHVCFKRKPLHLSSMKSELANVYPIDRHPAFDLVFENSDKLILPQSMRHRAQSMTALFRLNSLRHKSKPIICGVREFTAEEDTVYCPSWVLYRIGFRSNKRSGVAIEMIEDNWTAVSFAELHCDESLDQELCLRGLYNYSYLEEGSDLQVMVGKEVKEIHINKVYPKKKGLVSCSNLKISFNHREKIYPPIKISRPRTVVKEQPKTQLPEIPTREKPRVFKDKQKPRRRYISLKTQPKCPSPLHIEKLTATPKLFSTIEVKLQKPIIQRKFSDKGQNCDLVDWEIGITPLFEKKIPDKVEMQLKMGEIANDFPHLPLKTYSPRLLKMKKAALESARTPQHPKELRVMPLKLLLY